MSEGNGYYIGFSPQTYMGFSRETKIFEILSRILSDVDERYIHQLENKQQITIENSCEQKLILSELKAYIYFYIGPDNNWFEDKDAYAEYLAGIKKDIAHKRDEKSQLIRALIKMYLTFFSYIKERKE